MSEPEAPRPEGAGPDAHNGENSQPQRQRILLVGNDCVSKDVSARLRRAGYSLVKFDNIPAGIEAAAAVRFDIAVIDADGMDEDDLASVRNAFHQRGLNAIAIMRGHGGAPPDAAESRLNWRRLAKPVAFETLVCAFRAS